ncbi:MAG: Ig-like domain-containing protein [Bacteroidales bacterium]|nr:Ig-like domain-containing protein [Bacteroidales bacterium]
MKICHRLLRALLIAAALSASFACDESGNLTLGLTVKPDALTLPAEGGSRTFTLSAPVIWTASPSARWIQLSATEGDAGDDIEVVVSAEANRTGATRSGKIIVSGANVSSKSIEVSQDAMPPVPVTDISLNKRDETLKVGESLTITATVLPDDADNKTVTWTSSNASVASVSSSGVVKALAAGSTVITAQAGGKTATCNITVIPATVDVTGISLSETSKTLNPGESFMLTATVTPDNATDKSVKWSSSDETVVSVEQNGKVTALKTGTAVITAKAGDKTATCTVTVKPVEVSKLTLDKSSETLPLGQTLTLVATVYPDNATDKTISWSSSDASVASVDQNGKVSALKVGKATITAAAGGKSAGCVIIVTATGFEDPQPGETWDW